MPMVSYWRKAESVEAKVMKQDGVTVMKMAGEPHIFPGFPRGYLLYGKLSKIKHEIKNQVFNDAWARLERGETSKEIVAHIRREVFPQLFELLEQFRYDMVPAESMVPPVKEIYRAWTKVNSSPISLKLRDMLCLILQEDDSYRFRVQWLVTYFRPRWWTNIVSAFDRALGILEHAEVISDMKERQRLFRRIMRVILSDNSIRSNFIKFCKEVDWNKVKLSEADKFFFRGKYFKVDYDLFDY